MVVAEYKNGVSTIRIHDEQYENAVEPCMSRLSEVVSKAYKRRQLEAEPGCVAAMQTAEEENPKTVL